MSRGQRSAQQHGWFHLTDRGVDRQDIFIDDREHRIFLARAGERSASIRRRDPRVLRGDDAFPPRRQLSGGRPVRLHAARAAALRRRPQPQIRAGGLRVHRSIPVGPDRGGRSRRRWPRSNRSAATCTGTRSTSLRLSQLRSFPWSSYRAYSGSGRAAALAQDRTSCLARTATTPTASSTFTETPHPSDKTPANGRVHRPVFAGRSRDRRGRGRRESRVWEITDPARTRGDGLRSACCAPVLALADRVV